MSKMSKDSHVILNLALTRLTFGAIARLKLETLLSCRAPTIVRTVISVRLPFADGTAFQRPAAVTAFAGRTTLEISRHCEPEIDPDALRANGFLGMWFQHHRCFRSNSNSSRNSWRTMAAI